MARSRLQIPRVVPTTEARPRFGVVGAIWDTLRGGELSPERLALSLWVGTFIGCQPIYGLHLVLCALVCLPLRLDVVLAYLAANISNPLLAPFLLFLEFEVGTNQFCGFSSRNSRASFVVWKVCWNRSSLIRRGPKTWYQALLLRSVHRWSW